MPNCKLSSSLLVDVQLSNDDKILNKFSNAHDSALDQDQRALQPVVDKRYLQVEGRDR